MISIRDEKWTDNQVSSNDDDCGSSVSYVTFRSFSGFFGRMGWTHGKENQDIDEIPFLSLGIRRTEFNNLSFDISSMTWVIVRHWTRKFLINLTCRTDKQTRSSEKTEIQVLTTGRLSSLRNLEIIIKDKYTSPPLLPEPQRVKRTFNVIYMKFISMFIEQFSFIYRLE
ncbi:hypothetical protein RIR_jg8333.t1 [Rhizophagus irregularis DAOM 181602=DAOM 197198]|nr:hypothetical protein RIR_jg8333.t1 [Rhizophagus irregularis DAOM 181602=DAOM 197198]